MGNTQKQKIAIDHQLFARFTHPSPALLKKWKKRRLKEGNGQDVIDQEIAEWQKEGEDLRELKANYKKQLANTLWENRDFRRDFKEARKTYLENIRRPPDQKDNQCTARLIRELSDKHTLNFGWMIWIHRCLEEGENDPADLLLYLLRTDTRKANHIVLETYFPLPQRVLEEAMIYLRMRELDVFGDYYSQRQSGGRKDGTRPFKSRAEYNRIINYRYSPRWTSRTDDDFLKNYPEISRSKLARAKRWYAEGKP